jgi:SAM-dependent methyltransferase
MKNIDWYSHYKTKFNNLDFKQSDLEKFYKEDRELIDYISQYNPRKVIEAGAGLARDSLVLASKGIQVTLFDIDNRFLEIGNKNAERMGLQNFVDTRHGDLVNFSSYFSGTSYDLSFSSGVLEHFEDNEIQKILNEQLKVASVVIFTVPILSKANTDYFDNTIYRRLMTEDQWLEILSPFKIKEYRIINTRHQDLLVELVRS